MLRYVKQDELKEAEADLLVNKGVRHPFVSLCELMPFLIFLIVVLSAMVGGMFPSWVSLGVFPVLVSAAFWVGIKNSYEKFERRLEEIARSKDQSP